MRNRLLLGGGAWVACVSVCAAQTYHDTGGTVSPGVVPLINCMVGGSCAGPISPSNPLPVSGTFSASLSGFAPGSAYAAPLSASTTSSRVALPTGAVVVVYNTGANTAYVTLGGAGVVASIAADAIQPNSWMSFTVGLNTYLAAITASGVTTLNVSGGSGLPTGAGGGGGGGASVPTGSAGAPNANVLSVQGVSGGAPEPVSIASLPSLASGSNAIGSISNSAFGISGTLPAFATTPTINLGTLNGAATAAAQTSVESAPGTSASTALTIQGSASGVALPVTGTLSASVGGFAPGGAYASPLSVSTTSANVALPTGTTVVVYNTGANTAYVKLGTSGVTATTANDVVPAGGWLALTIGANTYLGAITSTGSTTLNISGGAGLATGVGGGGGGSGGTVAVSSLPALTTGSNTIGTVNLGTLNGASTAALQPTNAALGSTTSGQTGNLDIGAVTTASPSYTNGQSNALSLNTAGGLRVDGSAVTQPVSASALPLPSGAATLSGQTVVESAAGTSAASALTVQGSASGVALPVSISGGSVTATYYDSGVVRASAAPASALHSPGQSVGGLFTLAIARTNGGSGILTSVLATSSWGSTGTYVVRIWQKNPSSTTCTDNSAFSSSATDDANLIGGGPTTITFGTPASTTGDTKTYGALTGVTWDFKNTDATASQNLYVCLVNASSDTPGSSATLAVSLSGPIN